MMKKQNLQIRLAKYSAMAIPFLSISDLNAQVLYTDVVPNDTLFVCDTYALDLNNDGIVDFRLGIQEHIFNYERGVMILKDGNESNFVAGITPSYSSSYNNSSISKNAYRLNYQDVIGSANSWAIPKPYNGWSCECDLLNCNFEGQVFLNHLYSSNYFGEWTNDYSAAYLGLQIETNNQKYFGWVRVAVDTVGKWMIIDDYAVKTEPDESIWAGQCFCPPNGSENLIVNDFSVYPNPAVDYLYIEATEGYPTLPATLEILDLNGKKIISNPFNSLSNTIDVSMLPSGKYLLRIVSVKEVRLNKFEVVH